MIFLLAFLLTLCGNLLLCFSMKKHFRELPLRVDFSDRLSLTLRTVGYLLLCCALLCCSLNDGWALGLMYFLGLLTIAVLLIAIGFPYWLKFHKPT